MSQTSSNHHARWVDGLSLLLAIPTLGCGASAHVAQPAVHAVHTSEESSAPPAFFNELVQLAETRLTTPDAPASIAPSSAAQLGALDYDQLRAVRFRPEHALWRGEPGRFETQFFHLGHHHLSPVQIHVLDGGAVQERAYHREDFDVGQGDLLLPDDPHLGFAGFRVHAPLNNTEYRDEVIVFQGASYFRSLAAQQVYGLSARGLAIDTAEPSGEEFPRFSQFWLVRPGPADAHIWVLALLESRRATGAYAFRVLPGASTSIEVYARVFFREVPEVVGVAPLTSMHLFGEEELARFGDHRPEVHDSDTLLIHDGSGERLARPLRNPPRTTVSSFQVTNPRGFGLAQRDRAFESYQDLEAHYERRPTAWVEPIGDWGTGAIRLLEISTRLETDDNIGAMWVPEHVPEGGLSLHYRVHFEGDEHDTNAARVVATRVATQGQFVDPGVTRMFIDLSGGLAGEERTLREAAWVVDAQGAEVLESRIEANPHIQGLRVTVAFRKTEGADEVSLRGFLRANDQALSETWVYLWQPPTE